MTTTDDTRAGLVEQYEAMVARGHGDLLAVVCNRAGIWWDKDGREVGKPVVAACLQAGQLAAMGTHPDFWNIAIHGDGSVLIDFEGPAKYRETAQPSVYAAYCVFFPLPPAQPDPAAELAEAVHAIMGTATLSQWQRLKDAIARFDAAKGGE